MGVPEYCPAHAWPQWLQLSHAGVALLSTVMMLFIGCASGGNGSAGGTKDEQPPEVVLTPGVSVEATNKYGEIKISYVSRTQRRIQWNGRSKVVDSRARESRFHGKRGLLSRGDAWPGHLGVVYEEALLNFADAHEARRKLIQGSDIYDWVYTGDGLVVGWVSRPERNQVSVAVYQYLLNGERPESLAGARPDQIEISGPYRFDAPSPKTQREAQAVPIYSIDEEIREFDAMMERNRRIVEEAKRRSEQQDQSQDE